MGAEKWCSEKKPLDAATLKGLDHLNANCIRAAQDRARKMRVAYIVSNPVGRSGQYYWPGSSGVIDRDGTVTGWIPAETFIERMRPGLVVAPITRPTSPAPFTSPKS